MFADPTAYLATEGDITDFDEWTTVKRPALPGRIDRDRVNVIAVTDSGLEVLEPSGDRTPIAQLLDDEDDTRDGDDTEDGDGPNADQLLDRLR